jgi:hypothetical protein
MATSVRVGQLYRVTRDSIGGPLRVGDIVQIVNPPGGFRGGPLRHVMTERGEVALCNTRFLEGPLQEPFLD